MSESHTELKFLVSEGVLQKISEVRNLVGEATLSQIFSDALDSYLVQLKKKYHRAEEVVVPDSGIKNPSKKVARPDKSKESSDSNDHSRYVPVVLKKLVFARSGGQCEFVDPETKNRCLSRYRLQIDHVIPFALGGRTELYNLRHLCPNHNQRSAIDQFS